MNTRQIQPITTWSPETGDTSLDTLCLKDFYHYSFDDGGGKVSYTIQANELDILSGTIDIPSSIVQQWGADDTIIWNYVATTLNLTLL
jgi:hypothetical protein